MFKGKCFYCEKEIYKEAVEYAWVDKDASIDCEIHPAAFDPLMLKETGIKAPHLEEFEVSVIVRDDYLRKTQQVPSRAVDSNVVVLSRKARATSRKAAEKVLPKTGTLRKQVYDFLVQRGDFGATDQEMEVILGISGNTIRPTRISLMDDGWIVDSQKVRRNEAGNECVVWITSEVHANSSGKLFF